MQPSTRPTTVDAYIAAQPEALRPGLYQLRRLIRTAAPDAQEVISYGMPAYKLHGMLAYFSIHKNHYGLYVMPPVLAAFRDRLRGYGLAKSTIRFPFGEPIPEALIEEIIRFGAESNRARKEAQDAAKGKKATP